MKAHLVQLDGWSGGSPVSVRLASHNFEEVCHLNGQTWLPLIERLPVLRYDFFDGAFSGQIVSPTGQMSIATEALGNFPAQAWHDARLRIWQGDFGAAWAGYAQIFEGRVQEQPSISDGVARFEIGCDDAWLDQPFLLAYAGSGALEGGADLKGNVKPRLFGAPRFVDAVLIDAVNNVWQLGQGALSQVEIAFDRLSRFSAAAGDDASLAALLAATIAPGAWRTCLAQGLVRLGAPADGLLVFHARGENGGSGGWVRKPGAIIGRIAEILGASAKVNAASLTALDAVRPWNLSLAVREQTTARELIQAIAQSVNAVAVIDWLGQLYVLPVPVPESASSLATLAADGSALPQVASVAQLPIAPPFWRLATQADVTQRVHSDTDIAFVDPADLADVPLGSNLIVNSEFTSGLTGWSPGWDGTVGTTVNRGLDINSSWSGVKHVAFAHAAGTPAAGTVFDAFYSMGPGTSNLDKARKWAVPVMPGDRVYYSALVAGHRCNPFANLQYLDGNGDYLTEVGSAPAPLAGPNFANGDPANATRVGAFDTAPTGARFAFLNIRAVCPGGQADPYIFFSDGFIAKVDPNQTAAPVYTQGPGDRRADVTGENTAADTLNVGGVPVATVLGAIASAQATADGKIDTFYQASSPAGTLGDLWFDTDDGNLLYRHNGSAWVVAQDADIATAITAAAGAQATADGKVTTFYAASAPAPDALGDLWYQTTTALLYRWDGSLWNLVSSAGAPPGTNVGTTPATTVEAGGNAANNGVNSDGSIKDNKVDTPAIVDGAVTQVSSFFKSMSWGVSPTSSWVNLDDGVDTAEVDVDTAATGTQQVFIDLVAGIVRSGGSDDTISMRVIREDSVILPQVWSNFTVQGNKFGWPFSFLDNSPTPNHTHTYTVQVFSNDNTSFREVFLKALIAKR